VMNYEWGITCMMDSLVARLALQNRTFEGGEIDLLRELVETWRQAGDDDTADLLAGILADEIQHVRFANSWLRRLAHDDPRVLMKIAAAIRLLATVTAALAPEPGELNAVGTPIGDPRKRVPMVNVDDRRLAAFTEDEIREVLRQAGFRALLPRSGSGPRA
jgi:hypothetical protein